MWQQVLHGIQECGVRLRFLKKENTSCFPSTDIFFVVFVVIQLALLPFRITVKFDKSDINWVIF